MSPHHSDQMSQRSQVSRVALCCPLLFESDGPTLVGIELSQTKSGQLKKKDNKALILGGV